MQDYRTEYQKKYTRGQCRKPISERIECIEKTMNVLVSQLDATGGADHEKLGCMQAIVHELSSIRKKGLWR